MSARNVMQSAEKLYTAGFISYPRTETNIFPKEIDLSPMVQMQTQDQRWGSECIPSDFGSIWLLLGLLALL